MNLSVEDNILLPQTMNGKTKSSLKKELDEILEITGLTEKRKAMPNQLSGGQQQRVAIARAVIGNPKVILADEPTANLDSKNGDQILELMKKLNEELKTTFVFSTHDAKIVGMANHVIKISDGHILSA